MQVHYEVKSVKPISFDSLEYFNELKAAKVPDEQAQAQTRALQRVLEDALASHVADLATKADLALLRKDMETGFSLVRKDMTTKDDLVIFRNEIETRFENRMAESETRLENRMAESETRLDKRFFESENRFEKKLDERIELAHKKTIIKMGSMFIVAVTLILGSLGLMTGYISKLVQAGGGGL